ncbi:MAG: FG-GAP-like repeat-containing protein [Candidatus Latescibacterota bacterium]
MQSRVTALAGSLALTACAALFAPPVYALTWTFAEPADSLGWLAQESWGSGGWREGSPLRTVTQDGVWRIWLNPPAPGGFASARLTSPAIRRPVEWFEQLRLRIRLMEGGPTRVWLGSAARLEQGGVEHVQYLWRWRVVTLSADWQEVSWTRLDTTYTEGDRLVDLALDFAAEPSAETGVIDPTALLPGVELDWLTITGVGEQLAAESGEGEPSDGGASGHTVTWDFGMPGTAAGWRALAGQDTTGGGTPLRTAQEDGVWRVWVPPPSPGEVPSVRLVTPRIGQPAAGLGEMRVRLRLAGGAASRVDRGVSEWWATYERAGRQTRTFLQGFMVELTPEWQELTCPNVATAAASRGTNLVEVEVWLWAVPSQQTGQVDPGALQPAIDVAWYVIAAAAAGAEGGLPVPEATFAEHGELLGPSQFWPLHEGLGGEPPWTGRNLGDADGDGDLDIVELWSDRQDLGLLVGVNDGHGAFTLAHAEVLTPHLGSLGRLIRADLDGDGLIDAVATAGGGRQLVLRNHGEGPWERVADLDLQDRMVILVTRDEARRRQKAWVWNYAARRLEVLRLGGDWRPMYEPAGIDWPEAPSSVLLSVGDSGEGGVSSVVWAVRGGESTEYTGLLTRRVSGGQQPMDEFESLRFASPELAHVGDMDGDGHVEAVLGNRASANSGRLRGLRLMHSDGAGSFVVADSLPGVEVPDGLMTAVVDLNNDGRQDVCVLHMTSRQRGLVVLLSTPDGGWQEEGFYSLPGKLRNVVTGDVDGDGDQDVVVVNASRYGEGGVEVLQNLWSEGRTAVPMGEAWAQATGWALQVYPNPANPVTTVRYALPDAEAAVDLAVYDLLGQRVRTLLRRVVTETGAHTVAWSGVDDAGRSLASGVYLVRLQAGTHRQVCRIAVLR